MSKRYRERAEALAVQIILTQLLAHAFQADRKFAKAFAQGVEHSIDNFEFKNGWTQAEMLRGREFMRSAVDEIIAPALAVTEDRG